MTSREREAGELYSEGAKAVRSGGHELSMLAMHLILMVKGTEKFPGALWPTRELTGGKIVTLDRFIDYLLKQPREGLGLPSLYFLKQALEATPRDGERAISMVRAELAKEHVDFDKRARDEELKLHGEREPLADVGHPISSNVDIINKGTDGGTSSSYLAARLKRDHPEIAKQLAEGKFKSVRAAAIEAKIITPPTPLETILRLIPKLTDEEKKRVRDAL